jgi:hypothetical protein
MPSLQYTAWVALHHAPSTGTWSAVHCMVASYTAPSTGIPGAVHITLCAQHWHTGCSAHQTMRPALAYRVQCTSHYAPSTGIPGAVHITLRAQHWHTGRSAHHTTRPALAYRAQCTSHYAPSRGCIVILIMTFHHQCKEHGALHVSEHIRILQA